ncbi:MAG: TonB-dependent receptor [Pseudomonadota bacterium]
MKCNDKFLLSSVTLAVIVLMNQACAADQAESTTGTPSAAKAAPDSAAAQAQEVVVTGVASGGTKRKLDSAFSITTATEEQMKQAAPTSTADLLKISPGVYVESTGGQTGANIQIRGFPSGGDAPFVTLQLNGSPLFPAPTLSFLANDSTFRIDDTIERVEILRGGPSVIFSNGQPGATMNFILKHGGDRPEGSIRATFGSGNLARYDVFYGGKLADDWYGSIGGFYRTDRGVRDAGFPADKGGSLTATLTHRIQDGELTFYARATDDKNAFYTGVPVLLQPKPGHAIAGAAPVAASPNPGQLDAFPGIDPRTWTPMSNQTRLFTLPDGTRGDLADGRGADNTVFGFDFGQKVNGWDVNNKMNYFSGKQPTIGMFSGPSPLTMGTQIASFVSSANANAALVAAAGGKLATGGTAVYADGSGAVNANTQTIQYGLWDVQKKLKNFTDELRVTKEIVKDHTLTVGAYVSQYSSDDVWNLGNSLLTDFKGRPIQVTLNNGALATNSRGFSGGCGFCIAENGDTSNRALYVADEWKVTDRLKLDAGARYEQQHMNLSYQSPTFGNFVGNNPLAAYNYGVAQPNGPVIAYDFKQGLTSYTLGGIYKLDTNMSVFARINSGGQFPFFDQVRGGSTTLAPSVTKIKQAELGFKTVGSIYSAFVNLFANKFSDQFIGTSTAAGLPVNTVGGSKTYGIEYELSVRPLQNLQIALSGDVQHARYQDYDATQPNINSGIVQRQPSSQWRLTPSYMIPMGDNSLRFYGTYSHINARYSDQQNQEYLPSYNTVDAGVLLTVGDKLEFRLSGNNLTNEIGLTEGSAGRPVPTAGGLPYATIARSLFGRTVELSMLYRF